jgi:hypothetical protein
MAFNIQYGPISSALGLAQQAGKNQAAQQNFQDFTQFANLTNQSQEELDRRNANQIQEALQAQGQQNQLGLAHQQMGMEQTRYQAQNELAKAQMAATNDYREGMLDVSQQRADTSSQRAGTYDAYSTGRLQNALKSTDVRQQQVDTQASIAQQRAAAAQAQADARDALMQDKEEDNAFTGQANDLHQQVGMTQAAMKALGDPAFMTPEQKTQYDTYNSILSKHLQSMNLLADQRQTAYAKRHARSTKSHAAALTPEQGNGIQHDTGSDMGSPTPAPVSEQVVIDPRTGHKLKLNPATNTWESVQ